MIKLTIAVAAFMAFSTQIMAQQIAVLSEKTKPLVSDAESDRLVDFLSSVTVTKEDGAFVTRKEISQVRLGTWIDKTEDGCFLRTQKLMALNYIGDNNPHLPTLAESIRPIPCSVVADGGDKSCTSLIEEDEMIMVYSESGERLKSIPTKTVIAVNVPCKVDE